MTTKEYNNATPEDNARLADILNSGIGNEIYNKVLKFSFHSDGNNLLSYIKGRAYKVFTKNPCFEATSSDQEDVYQSILEGLLRDIKKNEGKFDPEKGSIEAWLFNTTDFVISHLIRDTYRLNSRGLGKDKNGKQLYPTFVSIDDDSASYSDDNGYDDTRMGAVTASEVYNHLSYTAEWDNPIELYSEEEMRISDKLAHIKELDLNTKEEEVLTVLAKTGSYEKTAAHMKMTQGALRKSLARLYVRLNEGKKMPSLRSSKRGTPRPEPRR